MPAPSPRRRLTAFAVAMAVLIATPLAVVGAEEFADVPADNPHRNDIAWLADAAITLGCNPPANTNYCPDQPVRRDQMASFLRRLAENQVVDADTVDGVHASDLVAKGEPDTVTSGMLTNEPGAAQASDDTSVSLDTTTKSLISQEIAVPDAGLVLVIATWEAWADHTNGTTDTSQFDVSDSPTDFPETSNSRNFIVPSTAPSGTYTVVSSTQRVFPVDSAGSFTFHLVGYGQQGTVLADDMVITLVYLPSTFGAIETLGVASSGADASD